MSAFSAVRVCGGYELSERLAGGGLTEVHLAHTARGDRVVVKLLAEAGGSRGSGDLLGRRLIENEARALAAVTHLNVVSLVETIKDDAGPIAIVREHLEGPTFASLIAEHGPLPWRWVTGLLQGVLRGLAAVHEAGYLHLDITPANILCAEFVGLGEPAVPKLIDFGLARPIDAAPGDGGEPSLGTAGYLAPERLNGSPVDPRSDLYSLGVVAFELLAGAPPVRSRAAPWPALDPTLPRLTEVNPAVIVPVALERALASLLEQDVDARPQTADEVLGLLAVLPPSPAPALDEQLARLAGHVRDSWISGVLDITTEGLTLVPQARVMYRSSESEPVPLGPQESLVRVFERAGGQLQITGPAGYGKTVQMLKVLRRLLDDYLRQRDRPVPVVFSMSEWRAADRSLPDFLVRQLSGKYSIQANHARRFVNDDQIIPLLDAVDEVAHAQRLRAVQAINDYLAARPLRRALVCFRSDIAGLRGSLAIETTVELRALEREQTARYLGGEWRRLRALLDRDAELERLSHTPLMLQLMRVSVQDPDFPARTDAEGLAVPWLYGRYVSAVLSSERAARVAKAPLLLGLGRVADTLRRCDRTMLVFEELQPIMLRQRSSRTLYLWCSRMAVAAVLVAAAIPAIVYSPLDNSGFKLTAPFAASLGLATFLLVGVGFVVWTKAPARWRRSIPAALAWGLVLGAVCGALLASFAHFVVWVFALEGAVICAMVLGVSRRERSFPDDDIATVEYLRWDFGAVSPRAWGLLSLTAVALLLGFQQFESTATALQVSGVVATLGATIVASRHGRIEDEVLPKLGIYRSLRSALLVAGLGFAIAVMALAPSYGPGYAALGGVFVATVGGLWLGGVDLINHCILRVTLAMDGSLSLRPERMLEDASDLGFLRRVGNGYMFAHSSLRDHFAERGRRA